MMRKPEEPREPRAAMDPRAMLANEQMKLKQLMQKRGELQHTLTLVEQQIMKVQGAMEILQAIK